MSTFPFWAAALKGSITYAFTHMGNFLLILLLLLLLRTPHPPYLQTLQGRCPAPSLNFIHNLLRKGTGAADHLTLLRLFHLFGFVLCSGVTPGFSRSKKPAFAGVFLSAAFWQKFRAKTLSLASNRSEPHLLPSAHLFPLLTHDHPQPRDHLLTDYPLHHHLYSLYVYI